MSSSNALASRSSRSTARSRPPRRACAPSRRSSCPMPSPARPPTPAAPSSRPSTTSSETATPAHAAATRRPSDRPDDAVDHPPSAMTVRPAGVAPSSARNPTLSGPLRKFVDGSGGELRRGGLVEAGEEVVQVGAGELPLERLGDLLVVAAEGEQRALELVEV